MNDMSEPDSLSARLRSEVLAPSSVVILTAAVVALVGTYIMQARTGNTTAGFGALLSIGVGVPTLYDEWRVRSSMGAAFLWSLVASALALGLYVVLFEGVSILGVDAGLAGLVAGGAAVSLGIVFSALRQRQKL